MSDININSTKTNIEQVKIDVSTQVTKSGLKYFAEIKHSGLSDYKTISANDKYILQNKIQLQIDKWNTSWNKVLEKDAIEQERYSKERKNQKAELLTKEAIENLKAVDNILIHTLNVDDTIDWEKLKDKSNFSFIEPREPIKPVYKEYPSSPDKNAEPFQPKFSLMDNIIKSNKESKIQYHHELYQKNYDAWLVEKNKIDSENKKLEAFYQAEISAWQESHNAWEQRKKEFYSDQVIANSKVDTLKTSYFNNNPEAIIEYCELVLNNSQYPDNFPQNFEIDYNPDNKILIVEYALPPLDQFQTLNEVKYIASRDEFKEYHISETQLIKLFELTMYKITLRTVHELFEADKTNALDAISFNGWINSINRATGKRENTCILSIQVKKQEFIEIDLSQVDPKACFKNFKGVGSSKLSGITPIQPILQIDKTDKRFVSHYNIADSLDNTFNLASMDWQDFEHLIREVFEKEFSVNNGEVKVTQASKDGGVDAIAFDPDPIRGGKIVIQAKRYTNTVGVSYVRDLYGTVMNEGATKGVLVTTSDYGPDAYEFAKGKPLTLLNGSNLLYLLEKHGHQARIDLKEAKRELNQ